VFSFVLFFLFFFISVVFVVFSFGFLILLFAEFLTPTSLAIFGFFELAEVRRRSPRAAGRVPTAELLAVALRANDLGDLGVRLTVAQLEVVLTARNLFGQIHDQVFEGVVRKRVF